MTKASDNAFPSILITEGTEPSAPAAGKQRLYIDSTSHLLKLTNSSGVDTNVGSGGLVLLEQHTASASASLDFTSFISSSYDEYLIEGIAIIAATNAQDLLMEVGTGGGPTWDTGNNYSWGATGINGSGTAVNHNGTTGIPPIFNGLANAAGYGMGSFSLRVGDLQSTTNRRKFYGNRQFANTAVPAEHYQQFGITWTNTTTAATGLRFIMSSGNITSGVIRIYGFAKS